MSKLDPLKEKLAGLKLKLMEKLEKIPFLKKLATKPAESAPSGDPAQPKPSYRSASLRTIFSGGGVLTRLQVLGFYAFLIAALASSIFVGTRLFSKFRSSPEHEKLVEDYSSGLGDIKRRMEENASVLALGKFTVRAFVDEQRNTAMSIDIWIRVSSVEAANYVQGHEAILHDKAMDALNEIFMQKVNLLTEPGKEAGKRKIIQHLNLALPKGKVEEVFFHNMVSQ